MLSPTKKPLPDHLGRGEEILLIEFLFLRHIWFKPSRFDWVKP